MAERARRSSYGPSVLALLVAGGGAFFASSRTWAKGTVRAEGLPSDPITVTGAEAFPIVGALSLVVVAAALAVLATRGRARQAVGALVVLASAGAVLVIVTGSDTLTRAFDGAVEASTAFTGANAPDESARPAWRWLTVATLLITTALGVLTVRNARRWPTMGRRYEAPAASTQRPVDAATDAESDIWKALDEGRDPTQ